MLALIMLLLLSAAMAAPLTCVDAWMTQLETDERVSGMPAKPLPKAAALRNLLISQNYFLMSNRFKNLTHRMSVGDDAPRQANWPTIATWASNSVGMSIREMTFVDFIDERPWFNAHLTTLEKT